MKCSLPVAFGFAAIFLVVLLSQSVVSQEPSVSFKLFVADSTCGSADGAIVIVYTEQGFAAVKKGPGCTCKTGSECTSGSCSCKLGVNSTNSRCCHKVAGGSCTTNDECQSNSCVSGKCEKVSCGIDLCDSRPNGDECKVNEDCQSGKCRLQTDGRYLCVA